MSFPEFLVIFADDTQGTVKGPKSYAESILRNTGATIREYEADEVRVNCWYDANDREGQKSLRIKALESLLRSIKDVIALDVGDKVTHRKGDGEIGFVMEVDFEYDLGGVTTCRVVWDVETFEQAKAAPREDQDIQWTNKLVKIE